MPKKGYKQTIKHREKISKGLKNSKVGNAGRFTKGHKTWNDGKRYFLECANCRKKTRTFKSRQRKYCSHKCHGISMMGNTMGFTSENMKGNQINKGRKPWNYIDGRSKLLGPARYGDDWDKIRLLIYARDKFTCQECGEKMSKIPFHIHHKIPFLISFDNSPKNLITLCPPCHRRIEAEIMRELKQIMVEV